ncbi:hypothetical protein JCM19241_5966 [Vibrio ishigakensis]|uniref:Uncharacterized protein n=1 Tax=Vibrio ishigakensis TaxID=1481914 RepID=A0A0B8QBM8_9VIBR|nr:hypothetical protein JCM19241_5966 [Vibrio ishigakensis]
MRIIALDGTDSNPTADSRRTATNGFPPAVSLVDVENGISSTTILWNYPDTMRDLRGTRVHVSTTRGFTPDETNLDSEVGGTMWSRVWEETGVTQYIRIGHVDVFGQASYGLDEISVLPRNVSDLQPNIGDELAEIRNPLDEDGNQITQPEYTIKAVEGDSVAGIGLFVDEDENQADVIVAARRFMIAPAGHQTWQSDVTYEPDPDPIDPNTQGDRVFWTRNVYLEGTLTIGSNGTSYGYSPGYGSFTDLSFYEGTLRNIVENTAQSTLQIMIDGNTPNPTGARLPDTLNLRIGGVDYPVERADDDRWVASGHTPVLMPIGDGGTVEVVVWGDIILGVVRATQRTSTVRLACMKPELPTPTYSLQIILYGKLSTMM